MLSPHNYCKMSEFKSNQYFKQIADGISSMPDKEKKDLQKKVGALCQSIQTG